MPQRSITRLPLTSLTTPHGEATFCRDLSGEDIRDLLRQGEARFVVADVGNPLLWIERSESFDFWKTQAKSRIVDPGSHHRLEEFPDGYFYFASEWCDSVGSLILLATNH